MSRRTVSNVRVLRRVLLASVVVAFATVIPGAQDRPLTNADVIRMIAAKLGDTVIISAIEAAPARNLDVSVDGLIALKQAGASDVVINAIQKAVLADNRPQPAARPGATSSQPSQPSTRPAPVAPNRQPTEMFTTFGVDTATGDLIPLEYGKDKRFSLAHVETSQRFRLSR
jgi:hypothetical protein